MWLIHCEKLYREEQIWFWTQTVSVRLRELIKQSLMIVSLHFRIITVMFPLSEVPVSLLMWLMDIENTHTHNAERWQAAELAAAGRPALLVAWWWELEHLSMATSLHHTDETKRLREEILSCTWRCKPGIQMISCPDCVCLYLGWITAASYRLSVVCTSFTLQIFTSVRLIPSSSGDYFSQQTIGCSQQRRPSVQDSHSFFKHQTWRPTDPHSMHLPIWVMQHLICD